MRPKTAGSSVPSGSKSYFFLMTFVNLVVLVTIHNVGDWRRPSYELALEERFASVDDQEPVQPTNIVTSTDLKSYDLAFNESFGFFDDIENHHWLRQKQKAKSSSLFKNTANPEKGIQNVAVWLLNNVEPMFTCPHIVRVGGLGDGAKWTCDPHRLVSGRNSNKQDCLVYSIGSAGRYQFEEEISKISNRQCEIHVFDPNPKYSRPNDTMNKNITYHAWGVKSSYAPSRTFNNFTFRTIPDTIERLGHKGRRIDIFKIDCEGCEWSSYKDWLSIDIRQLLIETHPGSIKGSNNSMPTFFQDLHNADFIIFSKEANTHPAIPNPGTMHEFSFIRLSPTFFERNGGSGNKRMNEVLSL